jgi:uncharacterized membrane-anchored protein
MTRRVVLILALQTLVLIAMVALKQWTLNTGTPILLETQPVDPRSLFRGDYVHLNYTINTIKLDEVGGDDVFRRYQRVYVVLKPGSRYWEPVSVHQSPPTVQSGFVIIKGAVESTIDSAWDSRTRSRTPQRGLNVRYGVEDYFVPEGTGRELEVRRDGKRVDLRIAVDRYGNAGIKAVLVDGEERYVETLF